MENTTTEDTTTENTTREDTTIINNQDYLLCDIVKNIYPNLRNTVINYYENGTIEEVYFCGESRNYKEGSYESYYENGKLKMKCFYLHNKMYGPVEHYYSNGQLMKKYNSYDDTYANGLMIKYYINGQLESKYLMTKGGRTNGYLTSYYSNGQLSDHNDTNANKRTFYYPCGKIRLVYDYENEEGIRYYINGNIHTKYKFKCELGPQNFYGKVIHYYENGRLKETGNYDNWSGPMKHGTFVSYYDNENNSKKSLIQYNYNECINSIEYDEDGNIIQNQTNQPNTADKKWYYLYLW